MKKHLFFALILFLALPSMAQIKIRPNHGSNHQGNSSLTVKGNSSLTVTSPRNLNYRFWLYVDDVLQNEQPTRSICIQNLEEDSYYIRVELDNQSQSCMGQFVDLKQSLTLSIVQNGKLFGLETSQAHVRPEVTQDLIVQQPEIPNIQPPVPPSFGMNSRDYDDACQLISNESFDNTKLTLAKQIVSSNPMTARQILGICQMFSFESNKLEFAKFAYGYCVDPNKYFLINEAFTYDSSKRELDEFIRGL